MSRRQFENGEFVVAVGVDHITSSFIQVYDVRDGTPYEDKEIPNLVIDNQGVQEFEPIIELEEHVREVSSRFIQSRTHGNHHPNVDAQTIIDIMTVLGFKNHAPIVFGLLD